MNWERGLIRLWLFLSFCWFSSVVWNAWDVNILARSTSEVGKYVLVSIGIWLFSSFVYFFIYWVILGFKLDEDITDTSSPKMTEKQNLPPEFDSPKDPESNVIRGSGEKFNNEFSDEISEERLKAEYEKSK